MKGSEEIVGHVGKQSCDLTRSEEVQNMRSRESRESRANFTTVVLMVSSESIGILFPSIDINR